MTKKHKPMSDEMLQKMKDLGVQVINMPDFKGVENLDDIDDVTLFSHLVPLMTGIAEAMGKPAPTHKEIKEALAKARELSKLQSSKEE